MAKKWKDQKSGQWFVRYKDNHGKWQLKRVGKGKTARDAEEVRKKYDSLEFTRSHELSTPIKGVGVNDIFAEFQKTILDPVLSEATHSNYRSGIDALKAWFEKYNIIRMDQITPAFMGTYNQYMIVEMGRSKTTARNYQRVLIQFLKWTIEQNYFNNYKLMVSIKRIPKPKRGRYRYYTIEELQKIFKYPDYSAAYRFLFYTGLRAGELCGLKWHNVKNDSHTLYIENTKALQEGVESIPLNKKARAILAEIPRISDYIFTNTKGAPLSKHALYEALKKILEKEEIKDGMVHTFRHSFASHLAIAGVSIHKIKELLRHSDIKMTMVYAHLNEQSVAEASEEIPEIIPEEKKKEEEDGEAPAAA